MNDAQTSTTSAKTISAPQIVVQPPEPFDLHAAGAAERWDDWNLEFSEYADIVELSLQSKSVQKGMFLKSLGLVGHKTYLTFTFSETEDKNDLDTIITKFDERLAPEKNERYENYIFRSRIQKEGESFDEWISDLRLKAETCNFGTALDRNLRDHIVLGIFDDSTRQMMLRKKLPDLKTIIDIGRKAQKAQVYKQVFQSAKAGEKSEQSIAVVQTYNKSKKKADSKQFSKPCGRCGRSQDRGQCPANGQQCHKCLRPNHFSSVCRTTTPKTSSHSRSSRRVHELGTDGDSFPVTTIESLQVSSVKQPMTSQGPWHHDLQTTAGILRVKLGTGADCNVISHSTAIKLKTPIIDTKPIVLEAYGGEKLRPIGELKARCREKEEIVEITFLVIPKEATPILGRQSCQQLSLIQRIYKLTAFSDPQNIIDAYPDVFQGIGTFGKPHKIQMEPNVAPINRSGRPIPIALYPKVKDALAKMECDGIIKRVTEPTDWCSEKTPVLKLDGTVRICIDPIDLKKAIKRPNHSMTRFEDLAARMPNAKFITVADADLAFWQVVVDEESSFLLTFATPFGRYRFLRLPMGTPDASEVFQQRAAQFVEGLEGVEHTVDDFIICGETLSEHNQRLISSLEKARKEKLKLKRTKLQLAKSEVKYCGHVISAEGIKPDPDKTDAILQYKRPEDKPAVRRLLGIIAYLQKFIPHASELTAPLRDLLTEEVTFEWTDKQQQAFEVTKQVLTQKPVLKLFDVSKPVVLSVDASSHGLGSVLLQDGHPVIYGSKALTPTQKNYAQIEKETMAILCAAQRLDKYIFGKDVVVETDHKPLEAIFRKPLSEVPAKLQRMLLPLQRYNLTVKHVPGSSLHIADALSRAHTDDSQELDQSIRICMITTVSQKRWIQFYEETDKDEVLTYLKNTVQEGWPNNRDDIPIQIRGFWPMRDDITIQDNVLLKRDRIIVPKSMQSEMLTLIHEGHLGARTGEDIELAILNLNNSLRDSKFSPNQLLMNRNLRTRLPTIDINLKSIEPPVIDGARKDKQATVEARFNQHTRSLPDLKPGDMVRMRTKHGRWKDAEIVRQLEDVPRSYIVKCQNATYRRNRRHLPLRTTVSYPDDENEFEDEEDTNQNDNEMHIEEPVRVIRQGRRQRQRPERYRDENFITTFTRP